MKQQPKLRLVIDRDLERYHFHLDDDEDQDGKLLVSAADARIEAVKLLGEMMQDAAEEFADAAARDSHLRVTDARGLELYRLTIYATVAPAAR